MPCYVGMSKALDSLWHRRSMEALFQAQINLNHPFQNIECTQIPVLVILSSSMSWDCFTGRLR